MSVLRHRPKGAFRAPFGLCVVAAGLMPTMIGHQDLAALIAQRPLAVQQWHSHNIASPFGTIEAATFSMPMPLSEAMPVSLSYALAGLDPGNADITGSIKERMLGDAAIEELQDASPPSSLPEVNRRLKGDRLAVHPQPEEEPDATPVAEQSPAPLKKGDRLVASPAPEPQPPAVVAEAEPPLAPPAQPKAQEMPPIGEGPAPVAEPVATAAPLEQKPPAPEAQTPRFSVASLDYGPPDDPTGYWPDLPGRRPDDGASPQPSAATRRARGGGAASRHRRGHWAGRFRSHRAGGAALLRHRPESIVRCHPALDAGRSAAAGRSARLRRARRADRGLDGGAGHQG